MGKKTLNIDLEKMPIAAFETLVEKTIKDHLDITVFNSTMEEYNKEKKKLEEIIGNMMGGF